MINAIEGEYQGDVAKKDVREIEKRISKAQI